MLNTCKSNGKLAFGRAESGGRVSNTLVTCPGEGDNHWKRWLRPRMSIILEVID